MSDLADVRRAALEIFKVALHAADPAAAVRNAVTIEASALKVFNTSFSFSTTRNNTYVIALGKASLRMASALDEMLDDRLAGGVLSGYLPRDQELRGHRPNPTRWQILAAGHPTPNEFSILAAKSAFDLLDQANRNRGLVIFLVSGGGSSMMELPRDGINVEEMKGAYQILVSCGATIDEINAVRRSISAVKGGGLARRAPDADQVTLIISDVNEGHEGIVAAGPTLEPPPASPSAKDVVRRYNLAASLSDSAMRMIERYSDHVYSYEGNALRRHFVLLNNNDAVQAATEAARSMGFKTDVAADLVEQPIAEGCAVLLSRLSALRGRSRSRCCVLSGGEFTCPVRGSGIGGRNSETVLRLAMEIDKAARRSQQKSRGSHTVVLSAGTDGIDGNSPAAGAIADEETVARALAMRLDPIDYLESSDSYNFFRALDDAIVTGPSGSNVRDIRMVMAS